MGGTAYSPDLLTEKVLYIDEAIQTPLSCAQRQLYLVILIYDDVAEFHPSWVADYIPYSCGHWYVFITLNVED